MKLIVGGHEVTNVNQPLFYYRQHPSSLSKDLSKLYSIRSQVIKKIANSSNLKNNNPLGIIPTRGSIHNSDNFDFVKLDGKYAIDWTVQSLIEAETINHIILSSPDKKIRDHVKKEYPQIEVRDRKEEHGFQNISLYETIKDILDDATIAKHKFDTILVKTIDTPFLKSHLIDQAINNIKIFNQLDSIVGVSESSEVYYQHDGSSLNEITNSDKHRLERETLYKKIKGFNIVKSSFYKEHKTLTGGVMGHIDIDETSAFKLDSILSLSLADTLAKTIKKLNN
jgi:CMP-N-acetylneuraminic acid synthetase